MKALDDRQLAALCADGDSGGWSELLARFDRRVLLVLLRAGIAEQDLPDLRQEIYSRLLAEKGAALRGLRAERPGALGAFLAQTALRAAIDHGRASGVRAKGAVDESEAGEISSPQISPEDAAQLSQGRARFSRALLAAAEGPQLTRDLMILRAHFVDGLMPQEIAAMGCGLLAKGVETVLRRARLKIEAELAEK